VSDVLLLVDQTVAKVTGCKFALRL